MKRTNYSILFLLFVAVFSFRQAFAQETPTPPNLKDFKFYSTANGQEFRKANLKPNMATVVFYFSPDCEHCQQQAEWVKNGQASFKNTQLMFVSDAEAPEIEGFRKKYFAAPSIPVTFVQDKDYKIDDYFGYSVVPSVFVYDKTGKLLKKFAKETPVAELTGLIK